MLPSRSVQDLGAVTLPTAGSTRRVSQVQPSAGCQTPLPVEAAAQDVR